MEKNRITKVQFVTTKFVNDQVAMTNQVRRRRHVVVLSA